ncbi:PLP-dependent aminotransferase family protein [Actinomadura oligospora]|uniref:MocR-like pyridoxine biosynthesis transcription factor PdxR n=1 Tax=Actinomadura oligospora TaxID=111804 RepID=UPI00047EAB6C|nr:PLP-dependent aminotransferase family protein [Actinomadura oligospora]
MSDDGPNRSIDLLVDVEAGTGRRAGLEEALRTAIRIGRLGPGTRLPASRALAAGLGISRGTVRAAYDQLVAEGYLTARQGSGTVVALRAQAPPEPRTGAPSEPRTEAHGGGGRYDLRPGSPDASAFPTALWLDASRRALTRASAEAFGYGDPRGRIELRIALAAYLGRTRGVLARPENILITNGHLQGITLLARVVGGTVAMEDPGVPFHAEGVRRGGAAVVPLPVDRRGARTDLLAGTAATAVEVTPAHQYPTGRTLQPERRRTLVEWARDTGGLIIENDYDAEFRYDRKPVGALQGVSPEEVAYLGTTSKTLGPALRLGWMVLPSRLVGAVADAKLHTDHHTEHLGQLALADLITRHAYDRHIRASRQRYRRRRDQLRTRLQPYLSHGLTIEGIAAGLHVLLTLPPGGPTEADVTAAATARELALGYLTERRLSPSTPEQAIIIGYGRPADHAYSAALDALTSTLDAVLLPPVPEL